MGQRPGRVQIVALISILLVGALLRIWNFPREREFRDVDEFGYLVSSLTLSEGITPPFKAAPGGAQIWLGWSYVMAKTSMLLIAPSAEERAAPLMLRPYVALNHVLWDCYNDIDPLRRFELVCIGALSLLSIVPAFFLGRHYAGLAGGVLVGGLVAVLPVFVTLAGHTRPYSLAWLIGFFALWRAVRSAPRGRFAFAAVLAGLAIATRIEMLVLLPFVLIEHSIGSLRDGRWRRLAAMLGLSLLTAAACAPWFFIGLFGSLKTIVAVRVLAGGHPRESMLGSLANVVWWQAALIPLLLVIVAIAARLPQAMNRSRWLALLTGVVALSMLRPSGYGPQHDGPIYLLLCVYAAVGLAAMAQWSARAAWIVTALAMLLPVAQTVAKIHTDRAAFVVVPDEQWINHYIPAGTTVYFSSAHDRPILPTPPSADRIWRDVVDPQAWMQKFRWGTGQLGVTASDLPRALSVDVMTKETGFARQWFILGGRSQVNAPRYDVHLFGGSDTTNLVDLAGAMAKGACVIAAREPVAGLGEPTAQWVIDGKIRGAIYCTRDIADQLPPAAKGDQH
jgi:hypothetical protein